MDGRTILDLAELADKHQRAKEAMTAHHHAKVFEAAETTQSPAVPAPKPVTYGKRPRKS